MTSQNVVTQVGFIGIGSMGRAIALNILRSGFDLMVFDIAEERLAEFSTVGARIGRSPAEVGAHGEIIGIAVVDDAQVEAVVLGENGVLSGARAGSIIAIHSTIHPKTVRRLASTAGAKGVGVVDAEVSGGAVGAQAKTLSFMVGGDKALVERCHPVFRASGDKIFHMGEVGMGAVTKLAHQVLIMGTLASVGEAMLLAERAGIDPKVFEQVVSTSAAQSFVAENWLSLFALLDEPGVEIIRKSVAPGLELAQDVGVALPLTALARQLVPAYILGPDPFLSPRKRAQPRKEARQ